MLVFMTNKVPFFSYLSKLFAFRTDLEKCAISEVSTKNTIIWNTNSINMWILADEDCRVQCGPSGPCQVKQCKRWKCECCQWLASWLRPRLGLWLLETVGCGNHWVIVSVCRMLFLESSR